MEVACAIITHIYQHFLQNDLIFYHFSDRHLIIKVTIQNI